MPKVMLAALAAFVLAIAAPSSASAKCQGFGTQINKLAKAAVDICEALDLENCEAVERFGDTVKKLRDGLRKIFPAIGAQHQAWNTTRDGNIVGPGKRTLIMETASDADSFTIKLDKLTRNNKKLRVRVCSSSQGAGRKFKMKTITERTLTGSDSIKVSGVKNDYIVIQLLGQGVKNWKYKLRVQKTSPKPSTSKSTRKPAVRRGAPVPSEGVKRR